MFFPYRFFGKWFREVDPLSNLSVCFLFPFLDRFFVYFLVFILEFVLVVVKLSGLIKQHVSFDGVLLDAIATVLVVISIVPKSEETVPHG